MLCGMKRIKFDKKDESLLNYEARKEFVEDNIEDIAYNNLGNMASNYLLSAEDLKKSGRTIDYPYFLTDKTLLKSTPDYKSYRKLKNAYLDNRDMLMTRGTTLKNIPDEAINENSSDDYPMTFEDNKGYILRLFKVENLDNLKIKRVIMLGCPMIDDVNENMQQAIDFIYEVLLESCSNEKDVEVLNYLAEGKTQTQIGKDIGISRQAVSKRLDKIIKNSKLLEK